MNQDTNITRLVKNIINNITLLKHDENIKWDQFACIVDHSESEDDSIRNSLALFTEGHMDGRGIAAVLHPNEDGEETVEILKGTPEQFYAADAKLQEQADSLLPQPPDHPGFD